MCVQHHCRVGAATQPSDRSLLLLCDSMCPAAPQCDSPAGEVSMGLKALVLLTTELPSRLHWSFKALHVGRLRVSVCDRRFEGDAAKGAKKV